MKDYTCIAPLLNETFNVKQLPNVVFNQNNSLALAAKMLVASSEVPDAAELDSATIRQLTTELTAARSDMATNGQVFKEFDEVADAMARKLDVGLSELKKIKTQVTKLAADIREKQKKLLADDLEVATLKDLQTDNIDFTPIDWNAIDLVGSERAIVMKVHGMTNLPDEKPIDTTTIGLVRAKLLVDPTTPDEKILLHKIQLTDASVAKLKEALQDRIDKYDINEAIKMLCNGRADCINITRRINEDLNNNPRLCIALLNEVRRLATAISIIKSSNVDFEMAESTKCQLMENCAFWETYLLVCTYVAIYYRRHVWKNAILCTAHTYNPDNLDEFLNSGGDLQQLALYRKYFHEDTEVPLPYGGVSVTYLLNNIDKAKKEIQEQAASLITKISLKEQEAQKQAFLIVVTNYLKDREMTWYNDLYTTRDHLTFVNGVYSRLVNDKRSLEDLLYDVYFTCIRVPALTQQLYWELGNAYLAHLQSTENFTLAMGDAVDAAVFAKIVCTFIRQHLLVILD